VEAIGEKKTKKKNTSKPVGRMEVRKKRREMETCTLARIQVPRTIKKRGCQKHSKLEKG